MRNLASDLGRGYAWVALLPHGWCGALLVAITFLDNPNTAAHGLGGALAARYGALWAGADADERPVAVFNGLLLGLLLAHAHSGLAPRWMLLTVACTAVGAITTVAGAAMLRRAGLGIYSLPFVLMALALTSLQFDAPAVALAPSALSAPGSAATNFANALGGLFFLHSPWAGWGVLLVIALASRYYLVLLLIALAISEAIALGAALSTHPLLVSAHANGVLAMLLVGGLMSAPGGYSLLCASAAATLAALLVWLLGLGMDVQAYSLPFVLASWAALWAMHRHARMPFQLHALPRLAEEAAIRHAMAPTHPAYRDYSTLSVPFNDIWTVSQGVDGPHTHVGHLHFALDFIRIIDGRSFCGTGATPTDFYAFDQLVFAPANGEVVQAVSHVPDNAIGEINTAHRWGNYIVIRMENGLYVLLAHLRVGSLYVSVGSPVRQGQAIGHCGNSGRSPQPHLHLHVQTTPCPGSSTKPFLLTNVWLDAGLPSADHALQALPTTGQPVCGAALSSIMPLALLPGRGLSYQVSADQEGCATWSLECALTPEGQWQLRSSTGANCIAALRDGMFCCSERNAVRDPYFDAWLMACANLAASTDVTQWSHHNQLARHSLSRAQRMRSWLSIPTIAVLHSHGERCWDASSGSWIQTAIHRQDVCGEPVSTRARIHPRLGAAEIHATWGRHACSLNAVSLFQRADIGVPGWETPLAENR